MGCRGRDIGMVSRWKRVFVGDCGMRNMVAWQVWRNSDRMSVIILIIKPTMHWFLKIIFGMKSYMFRTVPLSIIRSFSLYTQQWCMSYKFADSCQQTWMTSFLNTVYNSVRCCLSAFSDRISNRRSPRSPDIIRIAHWSLKYVVIIRTLKMIWKKTFRM